MRAVIAIFLIWGALSGVATAQNTTEFSALARLDVAQSQVRDLPGGGLEVSLFLSQPVPYRVFTLDEPRRLVLDFREVDWRGASRAAMLNADTASDLRFGPLRPGWSRLVVDLAAPLLLQEAGMRVDTVTGTAHLLLRLNASSAEDFNAAAGAPDAQGWEILAALPELPAPDEERLMVVIDPGHGGIDPGAERGGVQEAVLMLQIALELQEVLTRSGAIDVVLTREADLFVPLSARMSIARAVGADLLISLHADALEGGGARGASVYTPTDVARDQASARVTAHHRRADLLAGQDLSGQDDTVAMILMDLARLETGPASDRLANALVDAMAEGGVRMNSRPRREAVLAVLSAADFASVLVELGFLSDSRDLAALSGAEGRAGLVTALAQGVLNWLGSEAALAPLIRQ